MQFRSILKQIIEEGKLDKEAIARKLGTSTAMVEVLLDDMVNRGYLENDPFTAASGMCSSCGDRGKEGSQKSGCSGCGFAAKGLPESFWTITRKGEELLQNTSLQGEVSPEA